MGFRELCALIADETRRHSIPLLDVALVDARGMVLHRRFSHGEEESPDPSAPPAAYRAGSLSKMLTAVTVMRAVEAGAIDLDAPIVAYCPELVLHDPHDARTPITLRHLLSHTAGIARESPVGSYFDASQPSMEQSVRSMIGTSVVFPPGTRAKYSNIGPTMAAYVVEKATGVPWVRQVEQEILGPLGMRHSCFSLSRIPPGAVMAESWMNAFDGSAFPAPRFDLGTTPSGNLCSTAADLALFMRCLLAGGTAGPYRMLREDTLREMCRVQLASPGSPAGFGLGLVIGALHGQRHVGHGGAVYGYSADFIALIDEGVGVIVLNNLDCTGGVNAKVRTHAIETVLSVRGRQFVAVFDGEEPRAPWNARDYVGVYLSADETAEVTDDSGAVLLRSSGTTKRLKGIGRDRFVTDDRLSAGLPIDFARDEQGAVSALSAGGSTYTRTPRPDSPAGPDMAASLERYCGDYGPSHAVLRIFTRDSHLACRIEWFYDYDLGRVDDARFAFLGHGMYEGEELCFIEDGDGRIAAVSLSGIRFGRREGGQG